MVIEYLDWTNRFEFVEEKSDIKDRMKTQWVGIKKGCFGKRSLWFRKN